MSNIAYFGRGQGPFGGNRSLAASVKIPMHRPLFAPSEHWPPTRAEGLRRIADFVPRSGRLYAAERNFDRGPDRRTNVSTLSPYLRHRAVTETEVLSAVLQRYALGSVEKFVQEVFWRTYWKGWLQAHPTAWSRYLLGLDDCIRRLAGNSGLRAAYEDAVGGRTGIDAFDEWSRELVSENYLHNHARMWFASIWIFTLRLPWELGADFFMRHLLDGDPASNTLSWRWVAGLHTRGKTYTATRDNIRRYTDARFEVDPPLARWTAALEDAPLNLERPATVPSGLADAGEGSSLLLLHDDDLCGDFAAAGPSTGIRGVLALRAAGGRSPLPVAEAVIAFGDALAAEAVTRCATDAGGLELGILRSAAPGKLAAELRAAADACGATRIIVPFAPVGPVRTLLDELRVSAALAGFGYAEFGRRYDAVSWPAATRGFFNLRSRIPTILAEAGIGAG